MYTLTASVGWFPGEIYDKPAEAAKRGFRAMEVLGWKGLDLPRLKKAFDDAGMVISAINFGSEDPAKQEMIAWTHGIVHDDARDAFLGAIEESIAAAKVLDVKNIVITSGNEIPDVPRETQHASLVCNIRAAAKLAEAAGVTLVLEPLNRLISHKGHYLNTTAEAVAVVREVGSPNVRVLYDVFHQQITEGNVINNIRDNIEYIDHIHIGDVPGRCQPGTGEINYPNVFRAIADTGYSGFVVFECGITEDVDTVCRKMWAMQPQNA